MRSTQIQNGAISESIVSLYYQKQNYEIYWPMGNYGSIDFIAAKEQELIRIQVKTAYWMQRPNGYRYMQATIRRGSGKSKIFKSYSKKDCDVIAVVADEDIYLFPVEVIENRQTILFKCGQNIKKRPDRRNIKVETYKVNLNG